MSSDSFERDKHRAPPGDVIDVEVTANLSPAPEGQSVLPVGNTGVETDSRPPGPFRDHAESKSAEGRPDIPFRLISFIACVIFPFFVSFLYFAFIASDQFIAETRFAVRSLADKENAGSTGGNMLSLNLTTQDSYIVKSFIHSPEILSRIGERVDYRAMFANPEADFLSRFADSGSDEAFLDYWSEQVSTSIDGPSGIITLKVRAFTPENALLLAELISEESEKLINELSSRAQNDMLQRFQSEVERAAARYNAALDAMNSFQNKNGLLTPEAKATETGTLLTSLMAEKLRIESQIFVLKQSNAGQSPSANQLILARNGLENQISELRGQIAGSSDLSENIANSIKTFSNLETDRRVSESLYESARNNFEQAQSEAMRKALYLLVFVPPSLPQDALYPARIASPLLILLALTVAWTSIMLVLASIDDHRL